jgi:hypothetical protein
MLMACGGKRSVGRLPGTDARLDSTVDQRPDAMLEVQSAVDAGTDAGTDAAADTAVLAGRAALSWLGSSPPTLAAGQPIVINFVIESIGALNQVPFELTADLVGQNWPFTIVDSNQHPLTPPQVVLDIGQRASFAVRVAPPAGSTGQQFFVSAAATAGGVTGSSGLLAFTVGSPAPQPDPSFRLDLVGDPTVTNGAAFMNGDTIVAPLGSTLVLHFEVTFAADASASLSTSVDLLAGTVGWQTGASLQSFGPLPNQTQTLDVALRPQTTANAGFVRLNITNSTTQTIQSRVFAVRTN